VTSTILQNKLVVECFSQTLSFSVFCVSAPLRAQFHAKAQRRKVYFQYLASWYELRTIIQVLVSEGDTKLDYAVTPNIIYSF
jgi:hypothetical protein